eukprot:585092-Prymnesium_polylepis.2
MVSARERGSRVILRPVPGKQPLAIQALIRESPSVGSWSFLPRGDCACRSTISFLSTKGNVRTLKRSDGQERSVS